MNLRAEMRTRLRRLGMHTLLTTLLVASLLPFSRGEDAVVYDDDADCAIDCHWYCYTCSELATNTCPIMACTAAQRQCLWDYYVSTQSSLVFFPVCSRFTNP